jgi:enoyl-CoA hydratase
MGFDNIITETQGAVGLIRLNRPQALNALNRAMVTEIGQALGAYDANPDIGCVVMTGSEKAFAAGADIKEMQSQQFPDTYLHEFLKEWEAIGQRQKPVIAAVAGFALGGGCELAMMCDLIIAAETAKFGQPEITIGIMPGAGGTQRLARFIGKAKAMDMVLTGRMMDAVEAERSGLVSRVVAPEKLMEEAFTAAGKIASLSRPAVLMARESVDRAFETSLAEGLRFERRLFHAMFALADQKEGMGAFVEKRKPEFRNR